MNMEEIWRPIKNFEGLYEVSNFGRVKREGRLKAQHKNNSGYFLVNLYKNNIQHTYLVHRLVAEAFIENPNNYQCVNHKDEDKENNNANNLEWCTRKYNINYGTCAERIGRAHSKSVIQIDKNGNIVEKYDSILCAERMTGISNGNIGDCLRGRRKTAGGYLWEYAT